MMCFFDENAMIRTTYPNLFQFGQSNFSFCILIQRERKVILLFENKNIHKKNGTYLIKC